MPFSYKCSINFGLVYIPVTLHSCIEEKDIGFKLIDKNTLTKIKYKKINNNNEIVKNENIVKGYEYEKNKFVIFDNQDFEKIKTQKDKNITIDTFVNINEIDPIYYDKTFYVMPLNAQKAFIVLLEAMEKENKVAIAKAVLGTKENLISLSCKNGKMILNTLHFYDEVSKYQSLKYDINEKYNDTEFKLAKEIINTMSGKFEPQKYKNEFRNKLQKAIEEKIAGKEITATEENNERNIINLMDALQNSLKNKKRK